MEIADYSPQKTNPFENDESTYQNGGFAFTIKKIKWNDDKKTKYKVDMIKDGRYCGKFTFFTSDEYRPPEIIFAGMYFEPEYRSQGLSKIAMAEMARIASLSGRTFDHAVPQRKPLTCLILQKNGFQPCEIVSSKHLNTRNTVFIGNSRDTDSTPEGTRPVYVHFPDPHKAKEFANSTICKTQPYIVTAQMGDIKSAVRCVLNVDYIR